MDEKTTGEKMWPKHSQNVWPIVLR